MTDVFRRPKPTLTVVRLKAEPGFYVRMDPNAYASTKHIGDFSTRAEAKTWIANESAPWLAKLSDHQAKIQAHCVAR